MQNKINTNITIDRDVYDRIQEESFDFRGSFSKALNHYVKLGLERQYELDLESALSKDNSQRTLSKNLD